MSNLSWFRRDEKSISRLELRSYQSDIVDKILPEMDRQGNFSTVIDLATGGGKTLTMERYCENVFEDGNKVLWLCDIVELLNQAIDTFSKQGIDGVSYQLVSGSGTSINNIDTKTNILFVSMGMLRGFKNDDNFRGFVDWLKCSQNDNGKLYVIYDEAHHIGAESVGGGSEGLFYSLFVGDDALVKSFGLIGITATPFRMDTSYRLLGRWFKDGYEDGKATHGTKPIGTDEEFVGTDEEFIGSVKTDDIGTLISAGVLMKPTLVRVDDFEDGMPSDEMGYLATKIKNNYIDKKWNKTLVFVKNLNDAEVLQGYLRQGGVACFVYASRLISDDRGTVKQYLDDFKKIGNKNAPIMIAVNKVSEGFDVEDLETVYLYSPITSLILLKQRVGRVLRCCDGKDKATVYWQNYSKGAWGISASVSYNKDIEEGDDEIDRDIGHWRDGQYLPASIFDKKDVKINTKNDRLRYQYYEFLNIIDLFGLTLDDIVSLKGFFIDGEMIIPVREKEYNGYLQLRNMVAQDYYYSIKFSSKKPETFKAYAKYLGITSDDLLKSIKVSCFYRVDIRGRDMLGHKAKKRFWLDDNQIRYFCSYVLKNDLCMPEFKEVDDAMKERFWSDGGGTIREFCEYVKENNLELKPSDLNKDTKTGTQGENVTEKTICGTLLDVVEKIKEYIHKQSDKPNETKDYTNVLCYGSGGMSYTYPELLSVRTLMALGVYVDHEDSRKNGVLYGVEGELAFIGLDSDGRACHIKPIKRVARGIPKNDMLFLAQALNKVPSHICVSIDDVNEYSDALLKQPFANGFVHDKKKELVSEFIMALGYAERQDDIIRMQCKIFGGDLPRLLKYVIYCRCYEELSAKVKFDGVECKNVDELEQQCAKLLDDFGVFEKLELDVVSHVIEDYTPYIKPVKRYQGMKPKYLCNMVNNLLKLRYPDKSVTFIDAFGGSGTMTLNVNKKLVSKMKYNDKGICNYAFYHVLKDDALFEDLKSNVAELLKTAFECKLDERMILGHLKKYEYLVSADDIVSAREKYENDKVAAKKLEENRRSYLKKVLHMSMGSEVDAELAKIESQFHMFITFMWKAYNRILSSEPKVKNNVDLALLFLLCNTFYTRAFHKGVTIDNLIEFATTYEDTLTRTHNIIKDVELSNEDANKMLAEGEEAVWYCDIPYTGTDTRTYVQNDNFEDNFFESLSKSRGNYIVASRYSIWEELGDKTYNAINFGKAKNIKLTFKQYEILRFFGRFLGKRFIYDYKDLLTKRYAELLEDTENKDKVCIKNDKKAKYIVFSYTKSRGYAEDGTKRKSPQTVSVLHNGEDGIKDIEKMLRCTIFNNVPFEVMVTDLELIGNESQLPVQKLSDGVWYLQTYKIADFPYRVEPLTIIMEYKMFYKEMLISSGMNESDFMDIECKDIASAVRQQFLQQMKVGNNEKEL